METCPLCLQSFDEENKGSSSKKNSKERMTSGSSVSNSMKSDYRSKMTSGSKHLCGKNIEKKKQESEKLKGPTFIVERIEEMVCELEGYRWDATLMKSQKISETHLKHIFM